MQSMSVLKKFYLDDDDKFDFVMESSGQRRIPLTEYIELNDPYPGEPPPMKKKDHSQLSLGFINSKPVWNQMTTGLQKHFFIHHLEVNMNLNNV